MGFASGRAVRRTVLALFFLSGACALVYEVVWMRMLTLVFGATAFATSAVLTSFFTGLALDSLEGPAPAPEEETVPEGHLGAQRPDRAGDCSWPSPASPESSWHGRRSRSS